MVGCKDLGFSGFIVGGRAFVLAAGLAATLAATLAAVALLVVVMSEADQVSTATVGASER